VSSGDGAGIAARGGARIVWLPTVDSENEASEDGPKPAKQPVWRKIQDEFVAAGVASGSATPNRAKVGSITRAQLREIAQTKAPDLNATTIEAAEKIIEGTARSMGITVA